MHTRHTALHPEDRAGALVNGLGARAGYAHLVLTLTHGTHVSPFRHIFMFLLHTCRTQKHSHRHLYVHSLPKHQCTHSHAHTHPATLTPMYLQLIYKYIHTAVYTCAPQPPLHPHEHTQGSAYMHMHKSIFTYAHISQVHPGSHDPCTQ